MARKQPPWVVELVPSGVHYAFFISHVAEDSAEARQLSAEIHAVSGRGGRVGLSCFLDVENWPIGNVNSGVIREQLLRSAFLLAWVTPAYLANLRGWVWMELSYAELIERSLNLAEFDTRCPYIVPVFRGLAVEQIQRTPLLAYWERQLVAPGQEHAISVLAQKLVDFHDQERSRRRKRPT